MNYYLNKIIFNSKILGLANLLISGFMFFVIFTYDSNNPSFNTVSNIGPNNVISRYGAYFADFLMQTIGLGSFILAIVMLCWAIVLFRRGEIGFIKLRVLSLFLSAFSFSAVCSTTGKIVIPSGAGGYLGTLLAGHLDHNLLIALTFMVFTILFSFSTGLSKEECMKVTSLISSSARLLLDKIRKNKSEVFLSNRKVKDSNKVKPIQKKDKVVDVILDDSEFTLPSIDLLSDHGGKAAEKSSASQLEQNAIELMQVLKDFGVKGKILSINQGPVVTLYEFEPQAGTKSSRVIGLADDIARSLSAISTRIAIIPGKNALGIELPNAKREFFSLRDLVKTDQYTSSSLNLPLILGKDLSGQPAVVDLAKMPHLLVAGTTGSGKSVAINAMIISLLYKHSPKTCRFIMVDPKMLELSIYDGIPHLLTPVVTEPGKAVVALKWAVKEMENRYRLMSNLGVRNIMGYNEKIIESKKKNIELKRTVQTGFDPDTGKPIYDSVAIDMEELPFIVIIVDEMADLMIVAGKDIEASIQRLAQMARAAGIHLVMATQRPSVDVITGVIKANFPSRVSFKVTSKIDSRTILGEQGAEQLLGMGDMLFMGSSRIERYHAPFVSDNEVENITSFLKNQGEPDYINSVTESDEEDGLISDMVISEDEGDDLYKAAMQIVLRDKKTSISYIQRSLRIGYNRAANIVEKMEREGVLSPPNSAGKREILTESD